MNACMHRIKSSVLCHKYQITFFSGIIAGAISYLYVFVNNLFNCDNIAYEPLGYGAGITSGRWGLDLLAKGIGYLWGCYNIPIFNGIAALACVSLAACFVVNFLEIKNTKLCAAIGAITALFPPFASAMAYTFTVAYYGFAVLIGVAGVYFLTRKGYCYFTFGVAFISFSTGVYQAYLPLCMALLLLVLIKMCVQKNISAKEIIVTALKFLMALFLAYSLYYLVLIAGLKIFSLELTEYQGINSMGVISVQSIVRSLYECYRIVINLLRQDYMALSSTRILRLAVLVLYFVSACFAVLFIIKNFKHQKIKILLLILFLITLPIALNLIMITSPGAHIYTLMCMPFVSVFYLPAMLAENAEIKYFYFLQSKKINLNIAFVNITCATLFVASLNYAWQTNANFRSLYFLDKRLVNYYSEMYSHIRSVPEFTADKKILFVGRNINDASFELRNGNAMFNYGGINNIVLNEYFESRQQTIKNYLGYYYKEIFPKDYEYKKHLYDISQMKRYPDYGSIKVCENVILVRLE